MYLIVGLGNPDKIYENTFHNIGFMAIDRVAQQFDATFTKNECDAKTAHTFVNGEKVILAKPQTYMNLSGQSVVKLVSKYKIEQDKFFVLYDDIDLNLGAIRIRENGSAGTHNGMKNIVQLLGTQQFNRLRIGIGRSKNQNVELKDFVLSKVPKEDMKTMDETFKNVALAMEEFCKGQPVQKIMQKYNNSSKNL